jgi:hypothetical protein
MNPIIKQPWTSDNLTRWGIRGMDAFAADELVQLQQKVEEWIRQRAKQAPADPVRDETAECPSSLRCNATMTRHMLADSQTPAVGLDADIRSVQTSTAWSCRRVHSSTTLRS